jgi:NADPH-dependent 2,4-dienoyl-CoA reductase/sulfur reductase-like enzyme
MSIPEQPARKHLITSSLRSERSESDLICSVSMPLASCGVQTLDDGGAVIDYLNERNPKRVVVVGSGYIGIEMAERWQTVVSV